MGRRVRGERLAVKSSATLRPHGPTTSAHRGKCSACPRGLDAGVCGSFTPGFGPRKRLTSKSGPAMGPAKHRRQWQGNSC